MNTTQLQMDVAIQFNELEAEMTKRIKDTLSVGWDKERTVGVAFHKRDFEIKIYIDDREYHISVQGRGTDIKKYLDGIMEIILTEAKI